VEQLLSGPVGQAATDGRVPLPTLVSRHVTERPEQRALTSVGQGTVTWRELADQAGIWARWLASVGVSRGDRVVTLVPQSLEAAYVWLGCCDLGAVEVSVNTEFRGAWLAHALRSSNARLVVTSARYLDQITAVVAQTPVERVLVHDWPADTAAPDFPVELVLLPPGDPVWGAGPIGDPVTHQVSETACILYTSGTTGASKAVQVPWGLLHAQASCDPFDDPSTEVFYVPYAPYHLSGRSALYRGAITGGHTVVRQAFSTSAFWSDVREHGCTWTLLYAAPTRFLAGAAPSADDRDNPLRRVLMCPLVAEVDDLKERFGFDAYSVWGMTETGSPLVLPVELSDREHVGSCGRPVEGVEARLVDAYDYAVPTGQPGELVLRSDLPWRFTSGYQGAPEATAAAYRNGWFHTGDVFVEELDGTYTYVDRSKDMIRRRGENVSSTELEAAVLAHPGVAAAAAVGVPSPLGDEDILVAVVASPGAALDPGALFEHLRRTVPRFALPSYVRRMDELPRTQATQRVQKHELREVGVTADVWRPGPIAEDSGQNLGSGE
jgi:crotonobetaine/carnitine-CoA ligase